MEWANEACSVDLMDVDGKTVHVAESGARGDDAQPQLEHTVDNSTFIQLFPH